MINILKKNIKTAFLFSVIILLMCPQLFAAETKPNADPVDIEANSMSYDSVSDVYRARGNVVIIYSGGSLYADEVELDNKNNIATAQGNAFIKSGEDNILGDKIIFNFKDKTGTVFKGRVFIARNHFYIKGEKIEKTGELTYHIEKPAATTCDGDSPAWEFAGSDMKVTLEGYGIMKDAKLLIKDVPILYSPIGIFPAKTKRQSGFQFPYLSYSKDKDGIDIEIPYFWAINPQMDATLYQRYIEKRGLKEGAEFRYYAGQNSFGTFYGDYLEDKKNIVETVGGVSRDWEDMHRRWSYYLNHQTNFDSQSYLRTDLRQVSDKWYFRDFSAHNYYRDNYAANEEDPFKKVPFQGDESLRSLESTVRLFKGWSNYSLSALVSSTDDFAAVNNDQTLQKYPEITFTGIKQPFLKSPVYFEFTGLYDYFYRGDGQKGHFFDFAPTFSLPFNLSRYAKVIPQIGFRETYWSRDDDQTSGDKSGTRSIYNASLSMSSQVSRVFDVHVQNWEKIRHEIKPEIFYSYIPNIKQDNIPDYMPIIAPFVAPVTVPTNNVLAEQNAAGWALTNTFTAKVKDKTGAYNYLEFLRVKLFQTYDINESKKGMEGSLTERRPLSDIGLEVDARPHKYFSFMARNEYNIYEGWRETNYDLNISDWRGDNITIGYRYTIDSIEEINVQGKAVITKFLDGTFIARRDQLNSRTVENTVGLLYHEQCWAVGFDLTQTDTDTRFVIKFSLSGLGKMGM